MGLISRVTTVIRAKASKLIGRFEDPREILDYSYEKQLELLQNVKRGIVNVVTSKKRLELQKAKLQETTSKLESQAAQAVKMGKEDLARLALARKQEALGEIASLTTQVEGLAKEQEKLELLEKRLSAKVEAFRTRKEVIKAQYSAAEASVRVQEATAGISEEMADVGMALQRAEDKTEQMKARAAAVDELVASGALEDVTEHKDVIERELEKVQVAEAVEKELAELKKGAVS